MDDHMPKARQILRLLSLSTLLMVTACSGRQDWPSLSCWGEVAPATAEPEGGTAPRPVVEAPAIPDISFDGDYWYERFQSQWQVFEDAVARIKTATDQEAAMAHWLGAQLELTSVSDILSEFNDATRGMGGDEIEGMRTGWLAALENATKRMDALKP